MRQCRVSFAVVASRERAALAAACGRCRGDRARAEAKPRTFWLLLLQVALVGATVGVERAVLPLLAKGEFGLASTTAAVSFIASFGLAKAPLNLIAGRLADRYGRRNVLLGGWLVALPVPALIAVAPAWEVVVAANLLLGAQQGLCWSTSLFIHLDVAGARRRGFAVGLNELFGYGGAALIAYAAGWLAADLGTRPWPFVLQGALIIAGFATAALLVPETRPPLTAAEDAGPARKSGRTRFAAICQAGHVTKVADVVAWGLLPVYLIDRGLGTATVAAIAALYPAVWGALQPLTGALSDRAGRVRPIAAGLLCQAGGLLLLAAAGSVAGWVAGVAVLGAGTALAYPVLLAAAGDAAPAGQRASAVGVYRFWRDLGFVAGALGGGALADAIGTPAALEVLAAAAAASSALLGAALMHARAVGAKPAPPPVLSSSRPD